MREPRTWKGHQDKEGAPKTEVILATLMPGAGLCPMVGGGGAQTEPGSWLGSPEGHVPGTETLWSVPPSHGAMASRTLLPLPAAKWRTVRGNRGWDGREHH